MVVLFEEANTSPAFGAEADQVYTAPTVFVTLKATELPKQTGFGKAVKPAGAEGAVGLVKLTGPGYIPELHPEMLVILKSVYEPAPDAVIIATPLLLVVMFTVAATLSFL